MYYISNEELTLNIPIEGELKEFARFMEKYKDSFDIKVSQQRETSFNIKVNTEQEFSMYVTFDETECSYLGLYFDHEPKCYYMRDTSEIHFADLLNVVENVISLVREKEQTKNRFDNLIFTELSNVE